jgi:DNA-binding response OmpR family regulator
VSTGASGSSKRILVVDDNPVNLRITAALVRRAGFLTDTAETAESGLEHIAANPPDLIVTDLQLPGMDGLELTRTVKKNPAWQRIPVILLTAAHSKEEDLVARQAGCECSIGKPVDAELFPGIIRAFLGGAVETPEEPVADDLPVEQLSKEFLEAGASECRGLLAVLTTVRTFAPEVDFVSDRKSLHRWAGVGGTLGFPDITRLARGLETFLATYQPTKRNELRQKVAGLLEEFLHAKPLTQLPVAPRKVRIRAGGGAAAPAPPAILVGDDDAAIRAVIKQSLEAAGFECRLATDGVQALTMALNHPPAAIILDLNMPRMSGFNVLYWLRDQWSTCKVPVIVLTASHDQSDIARGVELGVSSYMVKPFNPKDLVTRVEQVIAKKP